MPDSILAEIQQEGPGRLSLSGEISFQSSPGLLKKSRVYFKRGGELEVSLARVSHVDSSAVALMLEWYRLAGGLGINMVFTHLPDALMDLVRVFNLDSRLPIRA